MPQMSPMNWLLLFVWFSLILFLTMVKINSLKSFSMQPSKAFNKAKLCMHLNLML